MRGWHGGGAQHVLGHGTGEAVDRPARRRGPRDAAQPDPRRGGGHEPRQGGPAQRGPGPGAQRWDRRTPHVRAGPLGLVGKPLAHRGGGDAPRDRGPLVGSAAHLERPSQRGEPVGHVLQPHPVRRGAHVEATPVVLHREREVAAIATQANHDVRGVRVLRHVLQRLEHREVDRGLDVARVAADAVVVDRDRDGHLARLRFERLGQTPIGQERRVDPARQVAQVLQRALHVVEDAVERVALPLLLLTDQPFGQPHLHGQRHQLLLRPVVDVAFQPAALLVLGRDQPLSRRTEILDQPEVLQDQSGLRGEVAQQPVLFGQDLLVRRLRDGERPEQIPPVADGDGGVHVGEHREPVLAGRDRRSRLCGHGPRGGGAHLVVDAQPHGGVGRARPLGQQPRHPRQDVLAAVRLADVFGESRQDLVRRGALAVDHAVRGPLGAVPRRLERDRDDGRRHQREELRGADERADHDDDRHVHDRDERAEDPVDDRLADDDIDVVEPVFQDRDADGHVQEHQREVERDLRDREVRDERGRERHEDEQPSRHEPLELDALVPDRFRVPHRDRNERHASGDRLEEEDDHEQREREGSTRSSRVGEGERLVPHRGREDDGADQEQFERHDREP